MGNTLLVAVIRVKLSGRIVVVRFITVSVIVIFKDVGLAVDMVLFTDVVVLSVDVVRVGVEVLIFKLSVILVNDVTVEAVIFSKGVVPEVEEMFTSEVVIELSVEVTSVTVVVPSFSVVRGASLVEFVAWVAMVDMLPGRVEVVVIEVLLFDETVVDCRAMVVSTSVTLLIKVDVKVEVDASVVELTDVSAVLVTGEIEEVAISVDLEPLIKPVVRVEVTVTLFTLL